MEVSKNIHACDTDHSFEIAHHWDVKQDLAFLGIVVGSAVRRHECHSGTGSFHGAKPSKSPRIPGAGVDDGCKVSRERV